jgi:SAM-dependent methyltransferase
MESMSAYALPHGLAGEEQRLALMSALLDPFELACIERVGVGPGSRCLEFGCGNGSISLALAERVAPTGLVIASDIDVSYVSRLERPGLEVRRIDILTDPIEESSYDFVVARALLHHVPSARNCLQRMLTALKPGGALLIIEPDMLPSTVAEPASMRAFWQGWLNWSVDAGIDYFIGRKIPGWLDSLGVKDITSEGQTANFNGGSDWANYWIATIRELQPSLLKGGYINPALLKEFETCYVDPHYWASLITFNATLGRKASSS